MTCRVGRVAGALLVVALLGIGCTGGGSARRHSPPARSRTTDSASPSLGVAGLSLGGAVRLHTSGSQLLTARNKRVTLRAVNEGRLDFGSGTGTPDQCGQRYERLPAGEFTAIERAGFNAVRLAISWANLEPKAPVRIGTNTVHTWNGDYLAKIDNAIRHASAAHVYVILDLHQSQTSPAFHNITKGSRVVCEGEGFPAWLFPHAATTTPAEGRCAMLADRRVQGQPGTAMSNMAAAWKLLARRYRSSPWVVGADLWNEPDPGPTCTSLEPMITNRLTELGRAVAAVNPTILLIFEDNSNYYTNHHHYLRRPTLANAVYSFHFYPNSLAAGTRDLNYFVRRVSAWNLPVLLGEFDVFGGDRNIDPPRDTHWVADTKSLMKILATHGISWALWEYVGTDSLLNPSTGMPKQVLLNALDGS